MQKPWFAIMNQNTVKIYSEVDSENSLKEIVTLQNPLGRERNRSLVRKQAGHEQKTIGRMSTVRYSHPKRSDPHEIAAKQFAKKNRIVFGRRKTAKSLPQFDYTG